MIETFDPGSGYPTSYEDIRGIARDPEWQCMLPKEFTGVFNEMPVHCKKAQLNGRDFNLPLALAESDPKRVVKPSPSLTDDRPPKFEIPGDDKSASNLALAFAAKATDKDSKEERNDCDWDKDGTDDCSTTITNPGPDLLDSLDASVTMQIEPNAYNLADLIRATRDVVENAKDRCADLLGKDALSKFDQISKRIVYDNTGSKVGSSDAITEGKDIFLNPWSYVFNEDQRTIYPENKNTHKSARARNESIRSYQDLIKERGLTSYDYAVAGVIHEFLHAIGVFPADVQRSIDFDGFIKVDSKRSRKNQLQVIERCFADKRGQK